jgi:3-hydroxyisobutyrate dehydrogenase
MEIVFVLSGAAEVYKFAASLGIEPQAAAELWESFNPGPQLTTRGKRMAGGNFSEVTWSLQMGRKDIRLMLESAARHGADLPALAAIAAKFDRAIDAGHGQDDIAAVGYDALPAAAAP